MSTNYFDEVGRKYRINLTMLIKATSPPLVHIDVKLECTTYGDGKTYVAYFAEGITGTMLVAGNKWGEKMHKAVSERIAVRVRVEENMGKWGEESNK